MVELSSVKEEMLELEEELFWFRKVLQNFEETHKNDSQPEVKSLFEYCRESIEHSTRGLLNIKEKLLQMGIML